MSSPKRGRRSRTWKIFLTRRRLGRHSPSRIWICRTVSFDTETPSISRSFSLANVAPKSA